MYIAKIWYPEEFIFIIENERLIQIGDFVDSHEWLYYVCCGVTAFITYWLYCCAVSHKLYLKWYEILIVVGTIVGLRFLNFYDETLATALSYASFLFLPALCGGDMKTCGLVFTVHSLSQGLSLRIRNLPIYLTTSNFITFLLLSLECYFWLLLFYVIFNYKKKEN